MLKKVFGKSMCDQPICIWRDHNGYCPGAGCMADATGYGLPNKLRVQIAEITPSEDEEGTKNHDGLNN